MCISRHTHTLPHKQHPANTCIFAHAHCFTLTALAHVGELREYSPRRQSRREKGERNFSWATIRIAELTQELEATKSKLRVSANCADSQMILMP